VVLRRIGAPVPCEGAEGELFDLGRRAVHCSGASQDPPQCKRTSQAPSHPGWRTVRRLPLGSHTTEPLGWQMTSFHSRGELPCGMQTCPVHRGKLVADVVS